MKKNNMTVYTVYLDDGKDCFKATVPAFTKQDAIEYCEGNGEVIAVKDSDLHDIDCECLASTLIAQGWGEMEVAVITRALEQVGLRRERTY